MGLIESMGPASGYMSVLVLALYIQSDAAHQLYRSPEWLWPICLTMIYWISRIWFLARRGELSSDPIDFALRDRHSLALGLLTAFCLTTSALSQNSLFYRLNYVLYITMISFLLSFAPRDIVA